MPEGEPSQFDPDYFVDEPSDPSDEPTTETEPSLEELKDPKFWEQEFQKQWEAKAGQEKNWSGLKYLRNFVLFSNDPDEYNQSGILPDGYQVIISRTTMDQIDILDKKHNLKQSISLVLPTNPNIHIDRNGKMIVYSSRDPEGKIYSSPFYARY